MCGCGKMLGEAWKSVLRCRGRCEKVLGGV